MPLKFFNSSEPSSGTAGLTPEMWLARVGHYDVWKIDSEERGRLQDRECDGAPKRWPLEHIEKYNDFLQQLCNDGIRHNYLDCCNQHLEY